MAPAEPVDFDRVFREYAAYVAAIGLKIMGRDDDLDDLVQGPVGSGTGAVVCRNHLVQEIEAVNRVSYRHTKWCRPYDSGS